MITSLRPPTKRMIEKLKDCLEKTLVTGGNIPCLPEDMKSSLSGLYKRGFIGTRIEKVKGKNIMCVYVTDSGKKFITAHDEKLNRRINKEK
ncbi:MAG: hypothetical protein ABI366_08990 [Ginsengibacter sp.]